MVYYTAIFIASNLFLISCVAAIGISSKFDFGESNPGIRPKFTPRIYNDGINSVPNFGNAQVDPSMQTVDCVTNFCDSTKFIRTDSKDSASTDVLVHIKTNVETPTIKNDTVLNIPDIPVIEGTRGTSPDFPLEPYPVFPSGFDSEYPINGIHQPRSHGGVNNPHFRSYVPVNTDNSFIRPLDDNSRYTPQMNWYPHPREGGGSVHNPLEFRKVYKNTWPTGFGNDWSELAQRRQADNSVPNWTPCMCDSQQPQNYPENRNPYEWNGRS